MKIVVFGATGSLGREVVAKALEQGHAVTAFVGDPAKLEPRHHDLRIARGDVLDYASVLEAIHGQEAVLCTLGAGRKGIVRSEGTIHIVRAMHSAHVQRLICQTTLRSGRARPPPPAGVRLLVVTRMGGSTRERRENRP